MHNKTLRNIYHNHHQTFNTAPLPQLVEQDDLEDSDDLDESDDSEDDDDELAQSALTEELERSEFEPYTDDGKYWT
jgi:hypothetical protein